ncbi:hypothetical protein FRB95_010629 [Tulasnella sp. JGI-2019a]|nr:hypothetical protein FRB93_013055 [Tulasnella sp. JGI-2019a]KAG9039341.1 hypothetical protein FRB95_010629 [Tulasnella sp. JGI-2019a]
MPPHTPTYNTSLNSPVVVSSPKPHPPYRSAKPAVATPKSSLSAPTTSQAVKDNSTDRQRVVAVIPEAPAGPYINGVAGPCPQVPRRISGDDGDLGFDFDWSSPPGAHQWSVCQTPDGRAIYSTKDGVAPGVVVEFLKCDW